MMQPQTQEGGFQPHEQSPEEEERLKALYRLRLLDREPNPEYDAIVQLAADFCEAPLALLSLVDRDRLWFKAKVGFPGIVQVVRQGSFCTHTIQQDGLMVIEDAHEDPRFRDNPRVQGEYNLRFYAGTPLKTEEGYRIGVLSVFDHVPRRLGMLQLRALEQLGRQLETHFRLHLQLRQAQDARARLHTLNEHLQVEIQERQRVEHQLQQALRQVEMHASRLEILVQEAHTRTRRLMEVSLDAVFVLDPVGCVLEVNPVACTLLGREAPQLAGLPFESLAPEPERLSLRRSLGELHTRGTMRLEDQGLRPATGGRVAVQLLGSIQDVGDTRRLLVIAHDLTERRRLEQQSIQNDRLAAMGVLAAGIAHEINNPTAYVLSNLEFLRQWGNELERHLATLPALPDKLQAGFKDARHLLADCIDGCSRINDIVRGMRHLSHQGHFEELTVLDVHSILDSVLHISQGELKHTARLEKHYAPELPLILGNEGRLGQVFLNLIVNAVQAMQPGTPRQNTLRVRTQPDGGQVRIDISDTGHGIPHEALPHIFDPFFTTKPAGVGTGLGLSISHAIVQKMGGELQVTSQVGLGTTFSLLLPAYHEP